MATLTNKILIALSAFFISSNGFSEMIPNSKLEYAFDVPETWWWTSQSLLDTL